MVVHHAGDYLLDAYAWDGYNNLFANQAQKNHEVWLKYPTLYSLIDSSDNRSVVNCASTFMTATDVSSLITKNILPIFDRTPAYKNLKLEYDENNVPYIQVPDMTFFQSANDASSLIRFFNLSERAAIASGTTIVINSIDVSFFTGDDLNLVLMDKGSYTSIAEASTHISSITYTSEIPGLSVLTDTTIPSNIVIDVSHDVYVLNETCRFTANPSNLLDSSTFMIDISGHFNENQLVNMLVFDHDISIEFGASYRVTIPPDGSIHTFDRLFPQFIIDDPSRYTIQAKLAYSSPVDYIIQSTLSSKNNGNMNIYTDDYRQYYLDETFSTMFLPFDHEAVIDQWFDSSSNIITKVYYYYDKPIIVDVSSLVILKSTYDTTNYMLNQKNIWTVKDNVSKNIVFKVHNESIPFIFDYPGYYDVTVRSYDYYGNLFDRTYEGFIKVV